MFVEFDLNNAFNSNVYDMIFVLFLKYVKLLSSFRLYRFTNFDNGILMYQLLKCLCNIYNYAYAYPSLFRWNRCLDWHKQWTSVVRAKTPIECTWIILSIFTSHPIYPYFLDEWNRTELSQFNILILSQF